MYPSHDKEYLIVVLAPVMVVLVGLIGYVIEKHDLWAAAVALLGN